MPARYKVTRRSGTHNWQLRYYVPRRLQKQIGKQEIVRSLQTPDKWVADERALDVVKEILAEIKAARIPSHVSSSAIYAEPTDEQITAAVRDVYEMEVESDLEERADPEHIVLMGLGGKQSAKKYRAEAKSLRKAAASGDFSVVDLEYWLEHFNFDLSENDAKRARFQQALAYVYAEAAERWAEHDRGRVGRKPSIPELKRPKGSVSASTNSTSLPMRSGAKDAFNQNDRASMGELWSSHERQLGSRVKAPTLLDRKASVDLFSDFVGRETSVSKVTRAYAREWREMLYRFPKMAAQRSDFKGKTFVEIVKLNERLGYETISTTTVSKHLSGASTFFGWLAVEGYVDRNIFEGLSPRLRQAGKKRAAFSDKQLRALFRSPLYMGCAGTGSIVSYVTKGNCLVGGWRFWLPLLSAFSAARLGELAQLEVNDIRLIDDIYCFDINADGDGNKTLKSDWSRRIVPVHSELLNLGFLTYVEHMQANGEVRLFPDLQRDSLGSFTYASKWFGKYFKKMKFEPDSRNSVPVFHSFRHSAVTQMARELSDNEIQPLIGHEVSTTTKGYRETATYSVQKRKQFIELIRYHGVDISCLNSRLRV